MSKFDEFLNEQLKNPEFKKAYDDLEPEYQVMRAMVEARKKTGLTQEELSRRTGITQADISKLEHGSANPSIKTLWRLARGMGMRVQVSFVSEDEPEYRA